jgi:formate dehydrogenase major subunit
MELTRRGFIKATGAAFATSLAYGLATRSDTLAFADSADWKLINTEEYTNICCYCAGGCGTIVSVRDGELINLEGDSDHPINQGGLCSKGASQFQLRNIVTENTREVIRNPNRNTTPRVRRPGATEWTEITWDTAIAEIARHVKETRDATFVETEDGVTVNRTEAIASLGGSQQNNEEDYLILKSMRSLGVVILDNQARVCHSSTVSGLAATFGRGSMTGHWCDFKNADVILTCGSNNVENHPESSRWVQRAVENGGTWICVDPRYTRTAAVADIYCPIRSGTDIAFWGGMINYIIEHDKWQHEYVLNYTNASYLIDPTYHFDVETGLFSGWDAEHEKYVTTSWGYQTEETREPNTADGGAFAYTRNEKVPEFTPPSLKVPKKDPTLTDPLCCFNVMKQHYSRYDLETVCNICGMDKETLELVYETYTATGAPEKSGALLYALGQTQHHYGAQNTRAMSLVQLILGNVGIAGGGVNALRGEPNVQGASDFALLVYDFPGYLKWPTAANHPNLRTWLETETNSDGYYTNKPKFFISALREWYGEHATLENDFGYDWLPKIGSKDYTTISSFELMDDGTTKGYFCWGMNPAHSAANASFVRQSLSKLDWLVAIDWVETETACFWKAPDLDPTTIDTEVYLLPAALIYEKSGSIANSGRWVQWRHKALDPVGEALPDYEICDRLWKEIVSLYREEGGACPEAILNVKWDYHIDGVMDPRAVAWGVNGYTWGENWDSRTLLSTFADLQADGSTSCALWIYAGYYCNNDAKLDPDSQAINNRSLEDKGGLGLYSQWSFCWPLNRRVLYNRASADANGKPWNPERAIVEWTGSEWLLNDVPDFGASTKAPDGSTVWTPPNNKAFMMTWEQNARFVCSTLKDAALPEHYEPFESPTDNALNGSQNSPMIQFANHPSVKRGDRSEYPYNVTTYSVVEHWQTGAQTRGCPVLVEAMPDQFIELSVELAQEKGISNGDKVRVWNNRGEVVVTAFVTRRVKPLQVNGTTTHQVGMVHHWSWAGSYSTGDTVNDLAPNVGDPNSFIPEYKAFLVNLEKA